MAERGREVRKIVERQMAALAADAEEWKAAATLAHVNAALSVHSDIASALVRISQIYDQMAASASRTHMRYLNKRSAA